jgi:hypothetical protein
MALTVRPVRQPHQSGGSAGLGILVAVFAAADSTTLHGAALVAHRISAALTVGAGLLALALVVTLAVRPRRAANVIGEERGREVAPAGMRSGRGGPA